MEFLSLDCNTTNIVVCEIDYETCKSRVEEYLDICSSSVFSSGIPTESSFRNLTLNFNVTADDIINFFDYQQDIVITKLRANTQTQIPIYYSNTIQIGTDTFQENTRLVIHSNSNTIKFENISLELGSIITIYTSNNSTTNLTIAFNSFDYDFNKDIKCLQLISDGKWSTFGVHTNLFISNQTVLCTTNHQGISTITVGRIYNFTTEVIEKYNTIYNILISILLIISIISELLLLSSLVIFIVSWKKFFSHDINILHFNNTLALFMAIISVPLIYPGYNANRGTAGCIVISFVLNCLWTNVFISSLSIAIAVFYTIWIVSIRHTARKLYKYLIPIGWGVSLLWSAASVLYNILIFKPSDYNPCFLFNRNRNFEIGWSFLGPMIVILLINTLLLILSLVKIWLVLRKQNTQEGELKRLRRVAIGGILLVPALGFPFISIIALQLYDAFNYDTATLNISSVQKNHRFPNYSYYKLSYRHSTFYTNYMPNK